MAEIYDSGDLVSGLRSRPQERGLVGTIASDPTFWSPGVFTYEVDIQDDISGTIFKVRRVRESVPWFYQSGGGLRRVGDRVLVSKLSRTVWEIIGDEISPEGWEERKPRVYMEVQDEDQERTSYLELTRDTGTWIRGARDPENYHLIQINNRVVNIFRVSEPPISPTPELGYAIVRSRPFPSQVAVQVQNSVGHTHEAHILKEDLGLDIARNIQYHRAQRE